MREIVIVLSDLYVTSEAAADSQWRIALPGLAGITRYADHRPLPRGWRAWLMRWFTGDGDGEARFLGAAGLASAQAQPASVVALGLAADPTLGPRTEETLEGRCLPADAACWIASPVHLVAGLTSLHLDPRSVIHLPTEQLRALAADFARVFDDSPWRLHPLSSGEFLLVGCGASGTAGLEPERLIGHDLAAVDLSGRTDVDRLHTEIQMWLHEHPVNLARLAAGQRAVSSLWLWGAGPVPRRQTAVSNLDACALAFGADAYLRGLWAHAGLSTCALPAQLAALFGYPRAQRAVLVLEIGRLLEEHSPWGYADALLHIDRFFLQPALLALRQRRLERLIMLANDREFRLRPLQRLKLWRRARPGLAALT